MSSTQPRAAFLPPLSQPPQDRSPTPPSRALSPSQQARARQSRHQASASFGASEPYCEPRHSNSTTTTIPQHLGLNLTPPANNHDDLEPLYAIDSRAPILPRRSSGESQQAHLVDWALDTAWATHQGSQTSPNKPNMSAPAHIAGAPSNLPGPNDGFLASVVHPTQTWIRSMDWNRDESAGGGLKSWTRGKKTDRKRTKQLVAAYLPDWVITFLLAGLLAILNKAHGYWRPFNLQDGTIQFQFAVKERVTTGELVVYTVIIPILILIIWTLLIHKSTWELHVSLLSFILSQALTLTATTIIKITVGRPRPDIIDRCMPRAGSMNAQPFGLATADICTSTDFAILRDGFRSFPSGHASTAFCGMTFLALYFTAKLRTTRQEAISSWLAFVFMMAAALIAISRTMDHRHHAADVIAGGILGTIIAIFTYHRYYPMIWSPRCYRPYPPRIPRSSNDDQDPSLTPLHRYDPHLPSDHHHSDGPWSHHHAAHHDVESRPPRQHPANGHVGAPPPPRHGGLGTSPYDNPPVVAPPVVGVPADEAARNGATMGNGNAGAGGYYQEPGYRTGV